LGLASTLEFFVLTRLLERAETELKPFFTILETRMHANPMMQKLDPISIYRGLTDHYLMAIESRFS